jgi:hypothetical protein
MIMNLEEFAARLDEFDQHVAAIMQMFKDDTGVTIGALEAAWQSDGTILVHTGLDFPSKEEAS